MFKKIEILRNIEYFSIQQSILIYKYNDESAIYLDRNKLSNEYMYYGYLNKNFIQYGKEGKHYLINIEKNEIFETPKVLLSQGFNGKSGFYTDNYIYDKAIKRSRSDLFQLDVSARTNTKKILENSADILILANETNLLFWLPKTTLKSLSLLTSEYEWQVDLGEYGEIRKVIGVDENNLWVSVDDAEYGFHHLLALDIQSGVVKKADKLDSRFEAYGVLMTEQNTVFSLKGRLGHASWLYEYDAQSLKELRAIEVPSLKEKKLGVKSFTVFKNYIYFTATDDSQIVANTVGVLDYQTLELLWYEKINPGNLMLDPPQVNDTNLYVLGADGTLHIFERETPPLA